MSDTRMSAAADQNLPAVTEVYKHPQGKTITVFEDGSYECRDAAGKKKPTSATPAKLRAGHGTWERVQ